MPGSPLSIESLTEFLNSLFADLSNGPFLDLPFAEAFLPEEGSYPELEIKSWSNDFFSLDTPEIAKAVLMFVEGKSLPSDSYLSISTEALGGVGIEKDGTLTGSPETRVLGFTDVLTGRPKKPFISFGKFLEKELTPSDIRGRYIVIEDGNGKSQNLPGRIA